MIRIVRILLLSVLSLSAAAQDVATAYELSELTSYIRLSRIADDTYSHLKTTIDSLD